MEDHKRLVPIPVITTSETIVLVRLLEQSPVNEIKTWNREHPLTSSMTGLPILSEMANTR